MKKQGKCCLCGRQYHHWGNNPYPLMKDTDKNPNRCCDKCNAIKVIPARFAQIGINFTEQDAQKFFEIGKKYRRQHKCH